MAMGPVHKRASRIGRLADSWSRSNHDLKRQLTGCIREQGLETKGGYANWRTPFLVSETDFSLHVARRPVGVELGGRVRQRS
jgi:hypothetical protein